MLLLWFPVVCYLMTHVIMSLYNVMFSINRGLKFEVIHEFHESMNGKPGRISISLEAFQCQTSEASLLLCF